jgi:hypothetical protein
MAGITTYLSVTTEYCLTSPSKGYKLGWWSGSNDECLPSKCETLNSNPSATKKKSTNW